jgi:hypothetical protein
VYAFEEEFTKLLLLAAAERFGFDQLKRGISGLAYCVIGEAVSSEEESRSHHVLVRENHVRYRA